MHYFSFVVLCSYLLITLIFRNKSIFNVKLFSFWGYLHKFKCLIYGLTFIWFNAGCSMVILNTEIDLNLSIYYFFVIQFIFLLDYLQTYCHLFDALSEQFRWTIYAHALFLCRKGWYCATLKKAIFIRCLIWTS